MMREQTMVANFHAAAGIGTPQFPTMLSEYEKELRINLMYEELGETADAIDCGDMAEAADGLADLMYVLLGTAQRMGIDLEPIFDEVHSSNMTKIPFDRRPDGKVLKGPQYQSPQIERHLRHQGWDGK